MEREVRGRMWDLLMKGLSLGWKRVGFRREGSRDEIVCGDEDVSANGEKMSTR